MNEFLWCIHEREDGWYWWNEDTGLPVGPYHFRETAEERCDLYYECYRSIACHHQ